jgi:hypothetical protein
MNKKTTMKKKIRILLKKPIIIIWLSVAIILSCAVAYFGYLTIEDYKDLDIRISDVRNKISAPKGATRLLNNFYTIRAQEPSCDRPAILFVFGTNSDKKEINEFYRSELERKNWKLVNENEDGFVYNKADEYAFEYQNLNPVVLERTSLKFSQSERQHLTMKFGEYNTVYATYIFTLGCKSE